MFYKRGFAALIPMLVEYNSYAFAHRDMAEEIELAKEACRRHGFTFGVQIHNTAIESEICALQSYGVPLTFHAPVLGRHYINLAAEDPTPALASLEDTYRCMKRFGAALAVFHGFLMTDRPILSFNKERSYDECLREAFRPDLSLEGSAFCTDFFAGREYEIRRRRVKKRLDYLNRRYPGVLFCLENDFPLFGSGFLLSEHARFWNHPLCLDLCHLWASAHILDRDFYAEVEGFLATGRVELVHLHASPCRPDLPKTKWRDGHQPLSSPSIMDFPRIIAACKRADIKHFTLEIGSVSPNDIELLGKWWSGAE